MAIVNSRFLTTGALVLALGALPPGLAAGSEDGLGPEAEVCAAVFEVAWLDHQGNSVPVVEAQIVASSEREAGVFHAAVVTTTRGETRGERLEVPGDTQYIVDVDFSLGFDPNGELVSFRRTFESYAACGEEIELRVDLGSTTGIRGAIDHYFTQAAGWAELPERLAAADLLGSVTHDRSGNRPARKMFPNTMKSIGGIGATKICAPDDFDDGTIAPIWNTAYVGDADQGEAVETGGKLLLSGDGTTLFHGTDNHIFHYQTTDGDFRMEVEVTDVPVDQGGGFRKAGLVARAGLGDLDPRVYINYLPNNPAFNTSSLLFDYRDEFGNTNALGSQALGISLPVKIAIDRRADVFTVSYSTDGGASWNVPAGGGNDGSVAIDMGSTTYVGLDVASYDANNTMTVEFEDFDLCRRNEDPPTTPPDPVTCLPGRLIDVLYMLDISGSMTSPITGASSKLDAGRQAMAAMNDIIEAALPGSRAGLVAYSGEISDPAYNLSSSFQVLSSMTTDFDAVDAAAQAIDENLIDPDTTTPVAIAFDRLREFMLAEYDPINQPIVVWLTDGVPNIDFQGFGPLEYRFAEVDAISLLSGTSFLSWGQVAWEGNYNGGTGTFDGEVLARSMFQIEQLKAAIPDTVIYSVAIQADAVFREDLLDYASSFTSGATISVTNATDLVANLTAVVGNFECGATIGDRVWNDANGDGVQDPGEAGIGGVTVILVDSSGDVVATDVTDSNGNYLFEDVLEGTYTVVVDDTTLPTSFVDPTFDLDGIGTPHEAVVTVVDGDERLDVDFGYEEEVTGPAWCPRTPGFWKNHLEVWPVSELEIGSVVYGVSDLLSFLRYGGPDASSRLARHLTATMLNLAMGSDTSIQPWVDQANAFLSDHPPGSKPKGKDKATANAIKDQLDAYNNIPCPGD